MKKFELHEFANVLEFSKKREVKTFLTISRRLCNLNIVTCVVFSFVPLSFDDLYCPLFSLQAMLELRTSVLIYDVSSILLGIITIIKIFETFPDVFAIAKVELFYNGTIKKK